MTTATTKIAPKVLIADHDSTVRALLKGLVKHKYPEARVFIAISADAALTRFRSTAKDAENLQQYDLAILDYEMLPGDTLEVAKIIVDSKPNVRCPVILYTARKQYELPDYENYVTYVYKSDHDVTELLNTIDLLLTVQR